MSERSLEQGEVMSSPESTGSSSNRSNHSEELRIQPHQNRKYRHKHKKNSRDHRDKEKSLLRSSSSRSDSRYGDHRSRTDRDRSEMSDRERHRKQRNIKDRGSSRNLEKRGRYQDESYSRSKRSRSPKHKKYKHEEERVEQKIMEEKLKEEYDELDELEQAFKDVENKKSEQLSETSDETKRTRRISKSGRIKSKFEDSSSSSSSSESDDSSSTQESSNEADKVKKPKRDTSSGGEDESSVEDDGFYGKDKEEEEEPLVPPDSPVELQPELPPYLPALQGCRNVEEFHCLNRIEEGTYGVVYRAKDLKTDEIVALKRLKMEREKEGFPITSLREINTLLKAQHPNIVTVREIVVGSNMDKIFIVMDYVEHDLKSLMESMKEPFIQGEVKTLMTQLLSGVNHLHDNWIIHRDLKTSNLLLSHQGVLKIGDFGLAREFGSPLKPYTPVVVTLWYRAPELLLQDKLYTTSIDLWSVGCIFGELLMKKALFPGKSEIDQLNRIFKELGTPTEKIWEGVSQLPIMKKCSFKTYIYNELKKKFGPVLTETGFDLMNRLLTYNPQKRITANEALKHLYFREAPLPVKESMFPTWPAKSEKGSAKRPSHGNSPKAPSGGKAYATLVGEDEKLEKGFFVGTNEAKGPGFSLKF